MPITPFHFGLGAALKSLAPRHFSFGVFCFTQVVTDTEVGASILLGSFPLHKFFHTYAGATLVGLICVFLGRPICSKLKRMWNGWFDAGSDDPLFVTEKISFLAACSGALCGAYSHVLLDSIMHADMRPFAPLNPSNPMLGVLSFWQIHLLCVVCGVFGVGVHLLRQRKRNR